MITVSRINQDISNKLEQFENPINNSFKLTYNEPFVDNISDWLMLWEMIDSNTYHIVGNNITITNTVINK